MDGDEEALRRFAREAVERLGRGQPSPSGQSFFSYRVLRALSPDTLVVPAAGRAARRGGPRRAGRAGGPADGAASGWPRSGRRSRRRCAGGRRRRRAGTRSRRTPSARWPTRSTSCGRSPPTWPSCAGRWRRWPGGWPSGCPPGAGSGREGRLDFRKTVRASLGTGGVPVVTHHRPRKVHKPELVVLCDVSGSVAGFSHFTLMLTQALREHFTGVRAFAFVDTDRRGHPVLPAGRRRRGRRRADRAGGRRGRLRRAQRLRHRLRGVRRPVGVGASGRRPRCWCSATAAPTTGRRACRCSRDLVRRSRSAHWLNPEPRRLWGSGDSRRRPRTARSSTWSSAATPPSWRSSSPRSDAAPVT